MGAGSTEKTRLELLQAFRGTAWVPLETLKSRVRITKASFFSRLYGAKSVGHVEGREIAPQRAEYRLTASGVHAMKNLGESVKSVRPDKAERPSECTRGQNERYWQKFENWCAILKEMKDGEWYSVPDIIKATRGFYAESSARAAVSHMEKEGVLESRRADLHGAIKQVKRLITEHDLRMSVGA